MHSVFGAFSMELGNWVSIAGQPISVEFGGLRAPGSRGSEPQYLPLGSVPESRIENLSSATVARVGVLPALTAQRCPVESRGKCSGRQPKLSPRPAQTAFGRCTPPAVTPPPRAVNSLGLHRSEGVGEAHLHRFRRGKCEPRRSRVGRVRLPTPALRRSLPPPVSGSDPAKLVTIRG